MNKSNKKLIDAANELRAVQRYLATISAPPMDRLAEKWRQLDNLYKRSGALRFLCSFRHISSIGSPNQNQMQERQLNPDLSEAHLFYCGCGACCSQGSNFAPALDFRKDNGVSKEAVLPLR